MKKKSTLEYPMSTLSAPVKPNDMVRFKQEPHEWETKWTPIGLVRKLADTTWEWVNET
jgi:hypothetical protein